jgi:proline dehydrogenase
MKKEGGPVHTSLKKLDALIKETLNQQQQAAEAKVVDFSNTEVAFADRTNEELKKTHWLFRMMNKTWLVDMGSGVGLWAIRWNLPFAKRIVKQTIFEQFVGGTTLLDCQTTIDRLAGQNAATILDYGAEGKETPEDFNTTMNETIRAIEFAATNDFVPVVSTKVSGMARNGLLQRAGNQDQLTESERSEYENLLKRIDSVCYVAAQKGVSIFFDAEESWMQDAIDHLVNKMMARYNQKEIVVYNTFQMYRHDRLAYLVDSFENAKKADTSWGPNWCEALTWKKNENAPRKKDTLLPSIPPKRQQMKPIMPPFAFVWKTTKPLRFATLPIMRKAIC